MGCYPSKFDTKNSVFRSISRSMIFVQTNLQSLTLVLEIFITYYEDISELKNWILIPFPQYKKKSDVVLCRVEKKSDVVLIVEIKVMRCSYSKCGELETIDDSSQSEKHVI